MRHTTDSKNMFWTPQSKIVRQHNTYPVIKHWLQKKMPQHILAKKQISTLCFKDRRRLRYQERMYQPSRIRMHPPQMRHPFFFNIKNIEHPSLYTRGSTIIEGDGFDSPFFSGVLKLTNP